MKLYTIAEWARHFETYETKKLEALKWVAVPNKHDGLGFRSISAERDGIALYGAWVLILQLASKSPKEKRGQLIRGKVPIDAHGMSLMTGFPKKVFERALDFFSNPRIGWILAEEWQDELPFPAVKTADHAGKTACMEWNGMEGMEGKGKVGRAVGTAPTSDLEFLAELGKNDAYRGINVAQEFAKMEAWCKVNKKQPSRRRFVNWLNRATGDRPMQGSRPTTVSRSAEPNNWRSRMKEHYPDWVGHAHSLTWAQLSDHDKKNVIEALEKCP
jgi:hypothetical protein